MAELIISPSARQDLSDIFDYIARDKPIAAADLVDTIQGKCELIASTPELGEKRPEYGPEVRSSVVGRYVIFYRPIVSGRTRDPWRPGHSVALVLGNERFRASRAELWPL